MREMKSSKLDPIGRLLLPAEIRTPLGLNVGDKLYATPSPDGKTVLLQKQQTPNATGVTIDNLGRVTLPKALFDAMSVSSGDTITLVPSNDGINLM